jgi:hypothetical protein
MPVLRPDLDSSQDSRKVIQGVFKKEKSKNGRSYTCRGGKISALWIVTTISIRTCTKGVVLQIDSKVWCPRETLE